MLDKKVVLMASIFLAIVLFSIPIFVDIGIGETMMKVAAGILAFGGIVYFITADIFNRSSDPYEKELKMKIKKGEMDGSELYKYQMDKLDKEIEMQNKMAELQKKKQELNKIKQGSGGFNFNLGGGEAKKGPDMLDRMGALYGPAQGYQEAPQYREPPRQQRREPQYQDDMLDRVSGLAGPVRREPVDPRRVANDIMPPPRRQDARQYEQVMDRRTPLRQDVSQEEMFDHLSDYGTRMPPPPRRQQRREQY